MATVQELVSTLTDKLARLTALAGAVLNGAVPVWVANGSYTAGQLRKSPLDGLFYIANTTHSSVATDPSADAVNWRQFDLDGFAAASHTHTTADITDWNAAGYLPLTGGAVSGSFRVEVPTGSPHIAVIADNSGFSRLWLGDEDDQDVAQITYSHQFEYMNFVVAAAERARIDSSGNLLVGKTAVSDTVAGAEVSADGSGRFVRASGVCVELAALDTTAAYIQRFKKGGSLVGALNVTTSALSLISLSDERMKANIVDAPDAGEVIDAIRVRSHDFHDGTRVSWGFVAQELHEVLPEAVVVGGEDPREEPWGVDQSPIVPLLLQEVKSLRRRVADLEAGA